MSYVEPSAQERLAMLRSCRTIAIVGMSADPSRASYFVATYLLSSSCDYEHVWFVNPKGGEILGQRRKIARVAGQAVHAQHRQPRTALGAGIVAVMQGQPVIAGPVPVFVSGGHEP